MKKVTMIAAVSISAFLLAFKTIAPTTWTVDKAHAKLGFSITHLMVSDVEGSFKSFDATITAPGDDFNNATVDFTADANSISTDNDARDKHIKGDSFLDVAKFPTLTFKSTSFKKVSGNNYKVVGNLTLHGVTKTISLDAIARTGMNPMSKKAVAGFKLTGVIKRSDFNIGASFPSGVLSDEVTLDANAEFGQK
ncbi:YceI family protein [Mucilaginibacter paludis]|uniref:YceI family protein n=1 Tax=Mucilaginibacter paludis DSM 18603 TaxID=714943 RepID=H1YAS6_9SPHI|nr:YceI family protein [Mucilaginibacter paludis]EHQ29535.1 YceI family protein [Mucilaginibacter paludis DSM 18603]